MRSDSTGSPKLSHHATSGSLVVAWADANWLGTSTDDLRIGVVQPKSASDAASAAITRAAASARLMRSAVFSRQVWVMDAIVVIGCSIYLKSDVRSV